MDLVFLQIIYVNKSNVETSEAKSVAEVTLQNMRFVSFFLNCKALIGEYVPGYYLKLGPLWLNLRFSLDLTICES